LPIHREICRRSDAGLSAADGRGRHPSAAGRCASLPKEYTAAIDGSEIGPANGSCGTAAFRKEPVYVADIERDPLWQSYRELARPHRLVACWSTPILSKSGAVLGSTLRGHCEPESHEAFEKRLIALGKSQGILVETDWSGTDVHGLVRAVALVPFAGDPARFVLLGPLVALTPQLALPLALALRELATNAAKYGALSTDGGRVEIEWGFGEGAVAGKFFLRWSEKDGPPVLTPDRQGFGSKVIKRAFASVPGSDAVIEYRSKGLVCRFLAPADQVAGG